MHAKRVPGHSHEIFLPEDGPCASAGVGGALPYHYDHSTRTGTAAAATTSPRNPTDSPRSKVTHRTHRTRRTPLQLTRWPMASWDAHRKLSFASSWLSSTAVDGRRAAPRYARAGAPGSERTARACGAAWGRSQRRESFPTSPYGRVAGCWALAGYSCRSNTLRNSHTNTRQNP